MLGESWPDKNPESRVADVALATRWVWAPLFVLVMAVAAFRFRKMLARPLLPMLIVTWFGFQAVSLLAVNEGRYRKPLEGLLVAQVLVLCDGWVVSRRRRSRHAGGHDGSVVQVVPLAQVAAGPVDAS